MNNPPLVILHGLFGSARNWASIAGQLGNERHILCPDLPGHGIAPLDGKLTIPGMADAVIRRIAGETADAVDLLGHSLGGKVAMYIALTRPRIIRRLVVVDIAPLAYPAHAATLQSLIHHLQALPLDTISSRSQASNLLEPAIPDAADRQFLLQNLILVDSRYRWRVDWGRLSTAIPDLVAFPPQPLGSTYPGSTLFIAGGRSGYIQNPDRPLINTLFPRSTIHTIPTAGHWPHQDSPEEFIRQVNSFLASPTH